MKSQHAGFIGLLILGETFFITKTRNFERAAQALARVRTKFILLFSCFRPFACPVKPL
jgi:hypothetical protein